MKAWLKKVWKRIEEAQQKRADYMVLNRLTNRELHDLGISRGQIRHLVYGDK